MEQKHTVSLVSGRADERNVIHQLCAIDKVCFGDIDEKDEGSEAYWFKARKSSITHAVFAETIPVGYIDFLKITKDGVESLRNGNVREGDMEMYFDTGNDRDIFLYLISICVLPEYRRQGFGRTLWNTSRNHIAEKNYVVQSLQATIWTEEGKYFFANFITDRIGIDAFGHPIVHFADVKGELPKMC